MTVRTLVTLPRSLVRFHLRTPLLSLAGNTLLVPILGAFVAAINGEQDFSLLDWRFGLWMWLSRWCCSASTSSFGIG